MHQTDYYLPYFSWSCKPIKIQNITKRKPGISPLLLQKFESIFCYEIEYNFKNYNKLWLICYPKIQMKYIVVISSFYMFFLNFFLRIWHTKKNHYFIKSISRGGTKMTFSLFIYFKKRTCLCILFLRRKAYKNALLRLQNI